MKTMPSTRPLSLARTASVARSAVLGLLPRPARKALFAELRALSRRSPISGADDGPHQSVSCKRTPQSRFGPPDRLTRLLAHPTRSNPASATTLQADPCSSAGVRGDAESMGVDGTTGTFCPRQGPRGQSRMLRVRAGRASSWPEVHAHVPRQDGSATT